jgi:gliding motility-associated-like protein
MKKWLLRAISAIALTQPLHSQNLVGNPYFELDTSIGCVLIGTVPYPNGWYEASGWGDFIFLNTCICQPNVPIGCVGKNGIPLPKFKDGMLNIILTNHSRYKCFASTYLQSPLAIGETYITEFYYRTWQRSNYFANRLGIVLSQDTGIVSETTYLNYTPVASINQPLSDTTQWVKLKFSFVAQGGETVLSIGNFWPDNQTTLIPNPPNVNAVGPFNGGFWPMIFIDGVFLYKATDTVNTATLPNDTSLCPNEQLVLHPQRQGFLLEDTLTTYLWSTGSTDSTITVTQPGTYWVQTTINQRFVAGDTIVVDYFPTNYQLNLPDTVTFCEGTEAVIQAAVLPAQYALLTAYLWNTGSTLTGIAVRTPGLYWLTAQTPCYNLADSTWVLQDFCESYLWVPNAFTPDGDGTNDFFEFQGAPAPVTLHIFDRWGKRVFYSDNYNPETSGWDGTYQGEPLPGGVYTYLIEYNYINPNATQPDAKGSAQQARGTVTIIR